MKNIQGVTSKKGKIKIGGNVTFQSNQILSTTTNLNQQGLTADSVEITKNFSFQQNTIHSTLQAENNQGITVENETEIKGEVIFTENIISNQLAIKTKQLVQRLKKLQSENFHLTQQLTKIEQELAEEVSEEKLTEVIHQLSQMTLELKGFNDQHSVGSNNPKKEMVFENNYLLNQLNKVEEVINNLPSGELQSQIETPPK